MTAGGPPKEALAKFQTYQIGSSTGVLGNSFYIVKGENTLKVKTVSAGVTNVVTVFGRIEREDVYNALDTITGSETVTIDISTIDYVKFVCSTYGGSEFELIVSGFYAQVSPTVTLSGSLSISGLSIGMRTTTQNITDVASALPASPLVDRNAITITNLDNIETIYFDDNPAVEANRSIGTLAGAEIGPLESYNTNITDAIILYAITETGKTVKVKITEIA